MACGNPRELLLPDVHLMLRGLSRRVRELGRGDRDMYACCYVGGESKGSGRLNWTSARKAVAREHDPITSPLIIAWVKGYAPY